LLTAYRGGHKLQAQCGLGGAISFPATRGCENPGAEAPPSRPKRSQLSLFSYGRRRKPACCLVSDTGRIEFQGGGDPKFATVAFDIMRSDQTQAGGRRLYAGACAMPRLSRDDRSDIVECLSGLLGSFLTLGRGEGAGVGGGGFTVKFGLKKRTGEANRWPSRDDHLSMSVFPRAPDAEPIFWCTSFAYPLIISTTAVHLACLVTKNVRWASGIAQRQLERMGCTDASAHICYQVFFAFSIFFSPSIRQYSAIAFRTE